MGMLFKEIDKMGRFLEAKAIPYFRNIPVAMF